MEQFSHAMRKAIVGNILCLALLFSPFVDDVFARGVQQTPGPKPGAPKKKVDDDGAGVSVRPVIKGTPKKNHTMSFTFAGPASCETCTPNPYSDVRFLVTFKKLGSGTSGTRIVVPGHFAADGNAANSHADTGNKWRVYFSPPEAGIWSYEVEFYTGIDKGLPVASGNSFTWPQGGVAAQGLNGSRGLFRVFDVAENDNPNRVKGRHVLDPNSRYRKYSDGSYYIQSGEGSPESFIAFKCFDNMQDGNYPLHDYKAHIQHWNQGDPIWQSNNPACSGYGNLGKGIIGLVNYLADHKLNSIYFLTFANRADSKNIWMWRNRTVYDEYDVSKLDQWEIVFEHADNKGMLLQFVMQQEENDTVLDGHNLGRDRKMYYKELVSRFGHHLAITWEMGEENGNPSDSMKDFMNFVRFVDPYDSAIKLHTRTNEHWRYDDFIGFENFDGPDGHINGNGGAWEKVRGWIQDSENSNRKWITVLSEVWFGSHSSGAIKADSVDPDHDDHRRANIWDVYLAGGAGGSGYFGSSSNPACNGDLYCNDHTTRNNWHKQLQYFQEFHQAADLPLDDMDAVDNPSSVISNYTNTGRVLADLGEVYLIYLWNSQDVDLNLSGYSGEQYDVLWFDPRNGGGLVQGTKTLVTGGSSSTDLGNPPFSATERVVLVKKR